MAKHKAAVIPEKHGKLQVAERDCPEPQNDEVLIKTNVVAVNPLDWKLQSVLSMFISSYPMVVGTDVAGVVVSVGSNGTAFKEGDRVACFATSLPFGNANYGAFQEYSVQKTFTTVRLPESMSFEAGATLPTAVATAAFSMFHDLGIARPETGKSSAKDNEGFLVWGGSSAVGTAAVQLAKMAGFTVYVTASLAHHDNLRRLGADHLFDYRRKDVVSEVVQAVKQNGHYIDYGFDPIAEGITSAQSAEILSQTAAGNPHLGATLPWAGGDQPENVQFTAVQVFQMPTPEESEFGRWLFNDWLPKALERDMYKAAPRPERVPCGINDLQEALNIVKAGVSGKKIVVSME